MNPILKVGDLVTPKGYASSDRTGVVKAVSTDSFNEVVKVLWDGERRERTAYSGDLRVIPTIGIMFKRRDDATNNHSKAVEMLTSLGIPRQTAKTMTFGMPVGKQYPVEGFKPTSQEMTPHSASTTTPEKWKQVIEPGHRVRYHIRGCAEYGVAVATDTYTSLINQDWVLLREKIHDGDPRKHTELKRWWVLADELEVD